MLQTVLKPADVMDMEFVDITNNNKLIAIITDCQTKQHSARWQATICYHHYTCTSSLRSCASVTKEGVIECEAIENAIVFLMQYCNQKCGSVRGKINGTTFDISDVQSETEVVVR